MKCLVVFDLDGTLVEFKYDYMGVRVDCAEVLRRYGVNVNLAMPIHSVISYASRRSGRQDIERELQEIVERYDMKAAAEAGPADDNVRELLEMLRGAGIRIAVLTNSSRRSAEICLRRLSISELVDVLVTGSDVAHAKPSPEGLMKILEKTGTAREDAVLIGDNVFDAQCAASAGVDFIGVTTGINSSEGLRNAGARYVVPSLKEAIILVMREEDVH